MNVAVIGSGITGLGAALELVDQHRVTLFESAGYAGGHANTVDIEIDQTSLAVDTGFLVLNERTYPALLEFFARLNVPLAETDMSFSASLRPAGLEWSGTDINALFAQRRNAISPRFWSMLRDILRFNRQATNLASSTDAAAIAEQAVPLGQWLTQNHYGAGFRNWYLLPMAAAIWSCPMSTMQDFPIGSFARFFHNHGLLQISNRPKWLTVRGGSRIYVEKVLSQLSDVRLNTPVTGVSRQDYRQTGKVLVRTGAGTEAFDAVIMATHSDQSLQLLDDPGQSEAEALSAIAYQPNLAVLHTDVTLMPASRRAWAAWNYMANAQTCDSDPLYEGEARVSVTYWLNRLQPLPLPQPGATPVLLTLNPLIDPKPDKLIRTIKYAHPVFDQGAIAAQEKIRSLQGQAGTWFCGAWLGYGFHEDGLVSGQSVARQIKRLAANDKLPHAVAA